MEQPEVGAGRISFDDLEQLIISNVHQNWDKRGVHAIDIEPGPVLPSGSDNNDMFEMAGEIYR